MRKHTRELHKICRFTDYNANIDGKFAAACLKREPVSGQRRMYRVDLRSTGCWKMGVANYICPHCWGGKRVRGVCLK